MSKILTHDIWTPLYSILLSPSLALLYPLPLITSRNKKEERRGEERQKNPFLRSNRETAVLYDGCSERTGRMNDIA